MQREWTDAVVPENHRYFVDAESRSRETPRSLIAFRIRRAFSECDSRLPESHTSDVWNMCHAFHLQTGNKLVVWDVNGLLLQRREYLACCTEGDSWKTRSVRGIVGAHPSANKAYTCTKSFCFVVETGRGSDRHETVLRVAICSCHQN